MKTKPTLKKFPNAAIKQHEKREYLNKFAAWLTDEMLKGNFTYNESDVMFRDFAAMSETRLKRLLNNFNL